MSITAGTRRKLTRFLEKHAALDAEAERLLSLVRPRVGPRKRLSEKSPKERREGKRKAHREETWALRAMAMERAGRVCEACFGANGHSVEMDHLESGSGMRRQKQDISTVWILCRACHRERTRNPTGGFFRTMVHCWAARHNYPIPRRYR